MARGTARSRVALHLGTPKSAGAAKATGGAKAAGGGRSARGGGKPEAAARSREPGRFWGRGGAERRATSERPAGSGRRAEAEKPAEAGRARLSPLRFLARLVAMVCAFAFMVAFAVVLAKLTLQPSPASEALTHTNLRPGRSLQAYLDQPELRDAFRQIGGNIVLGIPFGVLVPIVAPRTRGVLRVLLLTATVMLMVEFAQGAMVTGRAFDIDDVILNSSGALIGYLLVGRRLSRAVHPRRRRTQE